MTGTVLSPEGLDFGHLFAALAPDLVDVLCCCPQHLSHPLLLQLLLVSLSQKRSSVTPSWPQRLRSGRQKSTHLFLSLLEEEPEAFVLSHPGGQLPLALLPRLLQLGLQLPQHVQLSVQPGLSRPRHLQVQFQVQRSAQEAVQTLDGHRRLKEGGGHWKDQTLTSEFINIC